MMVSPADGATLALEPWVNDIRLIVAQAAAPNDAIERTFEGLVQSYRDDVDGSDTGGMKTVALAFRAEGTDLESLVRGLAVALFEEIEVERYDLRSVQFNGYVRTETGFAGWGYAHAAEEGVTLPALAVEEVSVESDLHSTTVRMSVRRGESQESTG